VQTPQVSPELADAADVLSDQLRVHLHRLALLLAPHASRIEHRFLDRLRTLGFEPSQRTTLAEITPGAAARFLARKRPTLEFIEQVEYSGRRLAKLNLPPSAILQALQEYDRLLTPVVDGLPQEERANFQWVREQLHFCVVLTLNNAYYQVREAETQAFYELFRIELESRNLEELLRRIDAAMPVDPVVRLDLRVPLSDGRTLALVHALGRVLHSEVRDSHMMLVAEVPKSVARRLKLHDLRASA